MAHDNPVPGYGTNNCINLRLWKARRAARLCQVPQLLVPASGRDLVLEG